MIQKKPHDESNGPKEDDQFICGQVTKTKERVYKN